MKPEYLLINFEEESNPDNNNRVGFNDPERFPNQNFHPTKYGIYKLNGGIVLYIPDYLQNPVEFGNKVIESLQNTNISVSI